MKTRLFLLNIFLVGAILFAFIPKAVSVERSITAAPVIKKTQDMEKEAWKADWEMTLKKARQEGEVAIIGGTSVAGLKNSTKLFKEKFGIDLIITTGRDASLAPKLIEERRTGLYLQDVMISGHTTMISTLKPAGFFDPLTPVLALPEVVDQKLWYEGRFDWADEGHYVFNYALYPHHFVVINTDLVKPGEIKSYYDLLNPKWKDRVIINDPTTSGMGNSGFISMVHNSLVDQNFFRQLASQKNMMTRDQDLQATWVARGKYPIALWPSLGVMARFIDAEAPVKPITDMKEGTSAGSTGSALCLFNKAPHPNAAKVFINWFLSREGQAINQKVIGKQTRRIDVSPEGLQPFETRIPGQKYFPKHDEREGFILKESKKYRQLAGQIFAPLK